MRRLLNFDEMTTQFQLEGTRDSALRMKNGGRNRTGEEVVGSYPASRYPQSSLRHWTLRPVCLLTFSIRKGALQVGHFFGMGRSHKAYSQAGYLLHAKNERPFLVRFWTRSPPQPGCGHFTPSANGLVVLHSGYAEQAMNLPKRPVLITIGLPHFSQT